MKGLTPQMTRISESTKKWLKVEHLNLDTFERLSTDLTAEIVSKIFLKPHNARSQKDYADIHSFMVKNIAFFRNNKANEFMQTIPNKE